MSSIASLSVVRATQTDVKNVVEIINEAFLPSQSKILDEKHTESKFRVKESFIQSVIEAEEFEVKNKGFELYLLVDSLKQIILGTVLLQTQIEGDLDTAKFCLLSRNPKVIEYKELKIGGRLIEHVIKRVEQLGKTKLKLQIVDSGETQNNLITFYEKYGFKTTGRTSEYPRRHLLKQEYLGKVRLIEFEKQVGTYKI